MATARPGAASTRLRPAHSKPPGLHASLSCLPADDNLPLVLFYSWGEVLQPETQAWEAVQSSEAALQAKLAQLLTDCLAAAGRADVQGAPARYRLCLGLLGLPCLRRTRQQRDAWDAALRATAGLLRLLPEAVPAMPPAEGTQLVIVAIDTLAILLQDVGAEQASAEAARQAQLRMAAAAVRQLGGGALQDVLRLLACAAAAAPGASPAGSAELQAAAQLLWTTYQPGFQDFMLDLAKGLK